MVLSLTPELRKHFGAADDRGVIVAHVEPNTPAAAAGIKVGDVIVEVHGQKIDAAPAVLTALSSVGKGEHARIAVVRDRKSLTLDATLSDNAPSTMMSSPWFREWMTPFDANRPLSSPFDGTWFREWMKLDPPKANSTETSTWLDKLHQLFAPKITQS
jgi:membrane-associated protease RseP (regulator of RpoE activity)